MSLYTRINKEIRAEVIKPMIAEMTRSVAKRAETRGYIWFKDCVIDDMVVNTMNSMDTGDNETNKASYPTDAQYIFSNFINGTLRAMAYEMLDRYLEHGKEDN